MGLLLLMASCSIYGVAVIDGSLYTPDSMVPKHEATQLQEVLVMPLIPD